ncbi:hypothetical protein [Streptomyces griseomycini]|uniref:Rubredoxin n=2 Tax=Streptomyces griseomycini TaxID=66895 RepID=A0A7W7PUQ2_9ACTN|nr:hypothetical protein [Streptomyces griseomycini]MBB4901631.1 rubredoxin [Streptomyces griseomycini]
MPVEPTHGEFAQHTARLVATVRAPLAGTPADVPQILHWPGRRLLVQRGDTELAVRDLAGEEAEFRFPAPWPRRFGQATVSPAGDLAVFSGLHALRAVDRTGGTRWEVRHDCWSSAVCTASHTSFSEYADDPGHAHADSGSAAFSPDGTLVWAHVRSGGGEHTKEEWLVLDSASGSVLGRAETMTVSAASWHFPHPDGAHMGLTVGQGDDDSPLLWGHWDGTALTFEKLVGEVFLDVGPSGRHFLTTDPGQWALYLHRTSDGAEVQRLNAADAVSPLPGDDMARWHYEAAFPYEDGAVVGTEDHADVPRHWLVDPRTLSVDGPVAYPFPVSGSPLSAGRGAWCTVSQDHTSVHLWSLAGRD